MREQPGNDTGEDAGGVAPAPAGEERPGSEVTGTPESSESGGGDEEPEGSTLERGEDPLDAAEIRVDPSRVRHAPRFGRFATAGGVLALVLAFLLAPFARYENLNVPWHFDPWGLALVLAAMLVPLGILLGLVVALISDRRSRRKGS